ncbi:MAG: chitobiase/beta-hexosaminidase C-terminal domain-containing protein, partial [Proteobacteria bacterium]|nr:chitobiase/beta-hexosaminidase C-terminal domain-containing protein [Pseudomonadota bacterium]
MLNHSKTFSIFVITGLISVLLSSCNVNWRSKEIGKAPVNNQSNPTSPNTPDTSLINKLNAPTFSIDEGTYPAPQTVEIIGEIGTTVHCTTDGSIPTCSSGECSLPFINPSPVVVTYKAITCKTGKDWLPSDVVTGSYIFNGMVADPSYVI